jgi:hypothetical protein
VGQHDGHVALPLLAEHPQPLGGGPGRQHLHQLAAPAGTASGRRFGSASSSRREREWR